MTVKVLKFGAEWCNACVQADRFLARTESEREVEVVKVDVDTQEELAVKYSIRNVPTFIAVKPNGDVVKKLVGFDTKQLIEFLTEVEYL